MNQKEQMFYNVGIVDFVLTELTEYLDTHPADAEAMEYFNHYERIKNQLVREFSQRYFPLNTSVAESNKGWRWGMAPLPWEAFGCGESDCAEIDLYSEKRNLPGDKNTTGDTVITWKGGR